LNPIKHKAGLVR